MAQDFRMPPKLCPSSVVRLIRPAGAYDEARLQGGTAWLRAQGLVVVDRGPLEQASASTPYYAGALAARVAELKEALADSEARALWAVRGGSGTAQLLPLVATELAARLARAPLWLIGFSDLTALHGVFAAHGVMSLHGANAVSVTGWGASAQQELLGHLGLATAAGGQPSRYDCTQLMWPGRDADAAGLGTGDDEVTGALVGGNLTVLSSLCGTGQLPSWQDRIVFLEEIDERPYRIDRCLHQLVAAGAFDGARAVVLGQFTRCDAQLPDGGSYTALQLIEPTLRALQVPVVTGVPVGHEPSSRSLILGATARLRAGGTSLEVCP